MDGRVSIFFGTRPEIIKLGPLIQILGPAAHLVHSGQHFDDELSRLIASDMGIQLPDTTLEVGGSNRIQQIGNALVRAEQALEGAKAVVVQGDTNSALAGALAANALDLPLFHVEAGLRSGDRRMPEEHNRIVVDHLADLCWAPTAENVQNLENEGISGSRVEQTGNPIVEALAAVAPMGEKAVAVQRGLGLEPRGYALATLHRPENVDDPDRLRQILESLGRLPMPVVFPIHPRTLAAVSAADLGGLLTSLRVTPPLGYSDFLALLGGCRLAISDSGGIQEEVSVLKVPLIVLRRSTERPEVLGTFATLVKDPSDMLGRAIELVDAGEELFDFLAETQSPYGDGSASLRMAAALDRFFKGRE